MIPEEIRRINDQVASRYDAIYSNPWALIENEAMRAILAPLLRGRRSVLDLGCGTGLGMTLIPESILDYTGIDISPKMLDRAKNRAKKRGSGRLIEGDLSSTLFWSDLRNQGLFFDCAISLFDPLNWLSREGVETMLRGLKQVLAPHSVVLLLTMSRPPSRRRQVSAYPDEVTCAMSYWTANDLTNLLRGAGFTGITTQGVSDPRFQPIALARRINYLEIESRTLGRLSPDAFAYLISIAYA